MPASLREQHNMISPNSTVDTTLRAHNKRYSSDTCSKIYSTMFGSQKDWLVKPSVPFKEEASQEPTGWKPQLPKAGHNTSAPHCTCQPHTFLRPHLHLQVVQRHGHPQRCLETLCADAANDKRVLVGTPPRSLLAHNSYLHTCLGSELVTAFGPAKQTQQLRRHPPAPAIAKTPNSDTTTHMSRPLKIHHSVVQYKVPPTSRYQVGFPLGRIGFGGYSTCSVVVVLLTAGGSFL